MQVQSTKMRRQWWYKNVSVWFLMCVESLRVIPRFHLCIHAMQNSFYRFNVENKEWNIKKEKLKKKNKNKNAHNRNVWKQRNLKTKEFHGKYVPISYVSCFFNLFRNSPYYFCFFVVCYLSGIYLPLTLSVCLSFNRYTVYSIVNSIWYTYIYF